MNYNNLDFMSSGSMKLIECTINDKVTPYFFIKENLESLSLTGYSPIIETKGKVFSTKMGVSLIIMFRFNKNDSLIYCQWFNFYNLNDRSLLDQLIFQKEINFCLIDENNNSYSSFRCENDLKVIIRNFAKKASRNKCTKENFEESINLINNKYKNRAELFHEIENPLI